MAIKSLYCQPEVCVRVNGILSKPFHIGVGIWQECVLSTIFQNLHELDGQAQPNR